MKAVVVYDSTYGNTEMIARIMAGIVGARVATQITPVADANSLVFEAGDVLAAGCPTQGHTATPAMRAWFKHLTHGALQGVSAVAFDTRFRKAAWLTGVAAHRIAREMQRAGATLLLPAESFFVGATRGPLAKGELDRVIRWAEVLTQEIERQQEARSIVMA